jgi:hypothetical protein
VITRGEFFMIKEMYERGMIISDIARGLETIGKRSENPWALVKVQLAPRVFLFYKLLNFYLA